MSGTPKTLTVTEIHQLLDELLVKEGTTKRCARGIRNYTIACLMVEAGLRVGEVVKLRWTDLYFNFEPVKSIVVPADIAKNNKERTIPVSTRLADALKTYSRYYGPAVEGYTPNSAFYHPTRMKPLTTRQVERFIRKAAEKALGRPVHPHVLRHTFATRLMRVTNARVVQELLGHESMTSTQIYMSPNADDKQTAIDAVKNGVTEQMEEGAETSRLASAPNRGDTR